MMWAFFTYELVWNSFHKAYTAAVREISDYHFYPGMDSDESLGGYKVLLFVILIYSSSLEVYN